MSIPSSSMASTATGLIWSAGIEPAERTSTAPPDIADRSPAAIWERPALWTQTNRALGRLVFSIIVFPRIRGRWSSAAWLVGRHALASQKVGQERAHAVLELVADGEHALG